MSDPTPSEATSSEENGFDRYMDCFKKDIQAEISYQLSEKEALLAQRDAEIAVIANKNRAWASDWKAQEKELTALRSQLEKAESALNKGETNV